MSSIISIIFFLFILGGFVFAFIPLAPALFLMFISTLIYAFMTGLEIITFNNLLIIIVLFSLSFLTDSLSGVIGAKWGGASLKSIWYGVIGLIIGTIILPPLGGIFGMFFGVLFSEVIHMGKSHQQALKSATGAFIGTTVGYVLNIFWAFLFVVFIFIFLFI